MKKIYNTPAVRQINAVAPVILAGSAESIEVSNDLVNGATNDSKGYTSFE